MEEKKQTRRTSPVVILLIVLLAAVVVLLAVLLLNRSNSSDSVTISDAAVPRIGYAQGVTIADDQSALQAAVDAMAAQAGEGGIMLEYKNDATSYDGVNFDCYIANSQFNDYDMYIGIYADDSFTDELFLSELIRPGFAFKTITLEHALPRGDHRVCVMFTQVSEVDGEQALHGQITVTMDLHVV